MRRTTKILIAFTILGCALVMFLTAIYSPQAKEEDLKTATVTLGAYRYELVGSVPKHRGSADIYDIIFKASDGQQYQIARFYKEEAEALSGHTVTIRYLENEGTWVGSHAVAELTEGETVHYTLEEWNRTRRNKVWIMPLLFFPLLLAVLCYVLEDVFGIFGRANRHRRHSHQKAARAEQLAELSNRPRNFPNTTWQTEDGRLTVTVDEQGRATGVIRVPEGEGVRSIPVIFDDTAHTTIRIALCEAGERVGPYIEIWEADYDHPDRFTAKPLKTAYFKKGKTLTVRRKDREGL